MLINKEMIDQNSNLKIIKGQIIYGPKIMNIIIRFINKYTFFF